MKRTAALKLAAFQKRRKESAMVPVTVYPGRAELEPFVIYVKRSQLTRN